MTSPHLTRLSASSIRLVATRRRNFALTPLALYPSPTMSKDAAAEPASKKQKKEEYTLYYVRLLIRGKTGIQVADRGK